MNAPEELHTVESIAVKVI